MTISRPWKQAALWLAFLAPFFYLTYGVANHLAAQRADVPSVVFGWEHAIPFLAWTIFPYWSINLFYGLSLFLCRDAAELHAHGRRLLTAQLVAVACFVLFPLGFSFGQPPAHGAAGVLFDALRGFDKPFNQAPSLHIALLVILWDLYRRRIPSRWRWALHGWSLLIAVSVLTTYQHHFIDIPTGALLGLACLWLWPLEGPGPLRGRDPAHRHPQRSARVRLAVAYALGAALCFALAAFGGAWLWWCWPGVALLLVAAHYLWFGARGFQKDAQGRMSIAARWLLWPYLVGAWWNSRAWTRGQPPAVRVHARLWLGRMPTAAQARALGIARIVDVSAELPAPQTVPVHCVPMLDLIVPDASQLHAAADAIDAALAAIGADADIDAAIHAGIDGGLDAENRVEPRVLVCCALGYSRSAAATAAWLLRRGHVADVDAALAHLRRHRPQLVLREAHRAALAALAVRG